MSYSYCSSHNIELSTINFDLSYIKELKSNRIKDLLNNNLLVVSMLDDKMYYNRNIEKSSYQYNNLLFINNEKDIIPLSFNIQDINSCLTINNGNIQLNIDNETIIDNNKELSCDFNKLSYASNENSGIFKVDNKSLIIDNDKVSLSEDISNVIDNVYKNIDIMDNVINQCSYNLNQIMVKYKDHKLYDNKYSCNIDATHTLYYSDETINNDNMLSGVNYQYYHHIDYYQHYFKIKINLLYNYCGGNIFDFCPFDEKNLNIKIENLIDFKAIDINEYIKFNQNKSYIFKNNTINFDEYSKNVFGEIDYICYFDILNDKLYELIKDLDNVPNHLSFKITFIYYDKKIDIQTSTNATLDLFIDNFFKKHQLHKILYHDYSVGFNYDNIGSIVGICMIPNSNNYLKQTYSNKPIFMKYSKNDKNYVINRVSADILKQNTFDIQCNNEYSSGESFVNDTNGIGWNSIQLISDDSIINTINDHNKIPVYKNIDINNIHNNINSQENINKVNLFYSTNSKYVNKLYNTKEIYGNYLEYAFNNTYNIYGNGLRKGDCYVPCFAELMLFYYYGFNHYIDDISKLDSSTLYLNDNNVYVYSIDYSNITYVMKSKRLINILKINEFGEYVPYNSNNIQVLNNIESTIHKSISLFKLPDYSIISGIEYYLEYNEEENCELISYTTKNIVNINIKAYNNELRTIMNSDFILVKNDDIQLSTLTIKPLENNMYQLCFEIKKYKKQYNDINIYYQDFDNAMNVDSIYINNELEKCRKLCKLSIKIG